MALQTWALSVCIIAVLLTLNFSTLKQFIYSLLKFDSKEKFIYLVLFITEHFTYFANGYLFYLFFVVKITLFNTVYCDG